MLGLSPFLICRLTKLHMQAQKLSAAGAKVLHIWNGVHLCIPVPPDRLCCLLPGTGHLLGRLRNLACLTLALLCNLGEFRNVKVELATGALLQLGT